MRSVTAHMRDSALHTSAPVGRFAGSGIIRDPGAIDFTDPANLAEYERALDIEIEKQKKVMETNDSLLPRWLRHGDSINRYNFAAAELENLRGAQAELVLLGEDIQRYEEGGAKNDKVGARTASSIPARDPGAKPTHAFSAAVESAAKADAPAQPGGTEAGRRTAKPFTPG